MRKGDWFRRRSIGIGWHPVSWEGWLVTGVATAAVIAAFAGLRHPSERLPVLVLIGVAYMSVVLLTGGTRSDRQR